MEKLSSNVIQVPPLSKFFRAIYLYNICFTPNLTHLSIHYNAPNLLKYFT